MLFILKLILIGCAIVGTLKGLAMDRDGEGSGRLIVAASAGLALFLAFGGLLFQEKPGEAWEKATTRYNEVSGVVLGEHLASKYPGSRALVLVRPTFGSLPLVEDEQALLDGLKKGFGKELDWVDTVEVGASERIIEKINSEPGTERMVFNELNALGQWFKANSLVKVLEDHRGNFDILVSTVGFPRDENSKFWITMSDLPDIALLNHGLSGLEELVREGVIDAMVVYEHERTHGVDVTKVPRNSTEAFDLRYRLVTADNLDE